jgi:hypothetical protein
LPVIGNQFKSKTEIPTFIFDPHHNGCYVDTPGFLNTKGVFEEICDSYCNARIFEKGNQIRIFFVADLASIQAVRGKCLIDGFNKIREMFPSKINELINSMGVIITKTKLP